MRNKLTTQAKTLTSELSAIDDNSRLGYTRLTRFTLFLHLVSETLPLQRSAMSIEHGSPIDRAPEERNVTHEVNLVLESKPQRGERCIANRT